MVYWIFKKDMLYCNGMSAVYKGGLYHESIND